MAKIWLHLEILKKYAGDERTHSKQAWKPPEVDFAAFGSWCCGIKATCNRTMSGTSAVEFLQPLPHIALSCTTVLLRKWTLDKSRTWLAADHKNTCCNILSNLNRFFARGSSNPPECDLWIKLWSSWRRYFIAYYFNHPMHQTMLVVFSPPTWDRSRHLWHVGCAESPRCYHPGSRERLIRLGFRSWGILSMKGSSWSVCSTALDEIDEFWYVDKLWCVFRCLKQRSATSPNSWSIIKETVPAICRAFVM